MPFGQASAALNVLLRRNNDNTEKLIEKYLYTTEKLFTLLEICCYKLCIIIFNKSCC